MSRAALEASPRARRILGRRPAQLLDEDLRTCLEPLLADRVEDLIGAHAIGEVDSSGDDVHTQWSVHRAEGTITAVSVSMWGHSKEDGGDRPEIRRIVEAMLRIADLAGWQVDSNVGPVTRARLDEVIEDI